MKFVYKVFIKCCTLSPEIFSNKALKLFPKLDFDPSQPTPYRPFRES